MKLNLMVCRDFLTCFTQRLFCQGDWIIWFFQR